MSPVLMRVLAGTDQMAFAHNSPQDVGMKAAARGWLRLIEELAESPDAELRIDDELAPAMAAE